MNVLPRLPSNANSRQILEESFLDSTTTTPIYFILSPGANVVGDLDKLADKYKFVKNESYHNVSMGQGQVLHHAHDAAVQRC